MKDREQFMQSVWEKSEKALAEERAVKARRRSLYKFGAAAAACTMLLAGAAGLGGPAGIYESLFPASSESITMDDAAVNEAGTTTECITPEDQAATADGSDNEASAVPGMSYDGAMTIDDAGDQDLYGELRKEQDTAEKAGSSKPEDQMGYYCLPIGIEIESHVGEDNWAMYVGDENGVMKYMKWFYSLPEAQVLTTEEFESLKEIPTGYYKFTMDLSMGADTEDIDVAFWLVGDIILP